MAKKTKKLAKCSEPRVATQPADPPAPEFNPSTLTFRNGEKVARLDVVTDPMMARFTRALQHDRLDQLLSQPGGQLTAFILLPVSGREIGRATGFALEAAARERYAFLEVLEAVLNWHVSDEKLTAIRKDLVRSIEYWRGPIERKVEVEAHYRMAAVPSGSGRQTTWVHDDSSVRIKETP